MSGENLAFGFLTRSNTNRAVQPQKMVGGLNLYSESRGVVLCMYRKQKVSLSLHILKQVFS